MGRDLAKMKAEVEAAYEKAGKPYKSHIPPVGSLPITVPGTVDAWFALHGKFGKLPIDRRSRTGHRVCHHGFPVTQLIAFTGKATWPRSRRTKA